MAKVSAKMPQSPMTAHGMSLQVKPQRLPHPVHAGRDTFGRMMPGQLMQNAAPRFQAKNIPAQVPMMPTAPAKRGPVRY